MAYLLGIVTSEEAAALKERGWAPQEFDSEAIEELVAAQVQTGGTSQRLVMVYVNNDLLSIMSGPDWEKGPSK